MFPRITNASDINRPVVGTPGNEQTDQSTQIYDAYDYQLTTKKLVLRIIIILFALAIVVWTLYHIFFVFNIDTIPATELSASEVTISSDQTLSFQLSGNDNNIMNNFEIYITDYIDGVQYITATKPLLSINNSNSQTKADSFYRKCELNIEEVTA
ncbi:MAG: hypothetical protein WBI07_01260, partial [Mobilitalea sp.]